LKWFAISFSKISGSLATNAQREQIPIDVLVAITLSSQLAVWSTRDYLAEKSRGKAFAPKFLNSSREISVRKCFTLLAVCRLSVTAGGLGEALSFGDCDDMRKWWR
jgi:hypothetical protein